MTQCVGSKEKERSPGWNRLRNRRCFREIVGRLARNIRGRAKRAPSATSFLFFSNFDRIGRKGGKFTRSREAVQRDRRSEEEKDEPLKDWATSQLLTLVILSTFETNDQPARVTLAGSATLRCGKV